MAKRTFSIMLASGAILGSSMVGCSGAGRDHRPAISAAQAPTLGARVEQALAGKDYARALLQAEALVAAAPQDGDARALLGRAYLANGRYLSARTAFSDAMTLGNRDVRTIISLALTQAGLGDDAAARALLADHAGSLPAADYGLAMAMAGDVREGARALLAASREPDATAQTRQNLAYALALGGAWGQARLVAGQDLPAREAEQRIAQWSRISEGEEKGARVHAMIGVVPRADDAGQPERLALRGTGETPARMAALADPVAQARAELSMASAEPAAAPAAEPVAMAAAEPKPASPDTLALAAAFGSGNEAASPMIQAPADPMRRAVRDAFQRSGGSDAQTLVARTGMSRVARLVAPVADERASDWVVQLGAYDNEAVAREKWAKLSRTRDAVGGFNEVHSEVTLNGRAFHRLAIRGFGDRASAVTLCNSLRASGQPCFVRLDDTDSTRMARARAKGEDSRVASAKQAAGSSRLAAAR
ncbi:SPOR domain-containing protein [Sphingobium sp. SYK-6]|uniref:SPOR domain-containing protein n=1 Tax=Sphingobium sp. (strain NBRC 103272 / SYK-6) TaxID=627192 RepID=UPI0011D2BF68|nr:SPOR domain-containing protein [Sphingobium sp. SYK-6]